MDQDDILMSFIVLELTDCLQERLAFDIAYRAADLDNGNFCILSSRIPMESALDFICNMRNYLYGTSAVITAAFL